MPDMTYFPPWKTDFNHEKADFQMQTRNSIRGFVRRFSLKNPGTWALNMSMNRDHFDSSQWKASKNFLTGLTGKFLGFMITTDTGASESGDEHYPITHHTGILALFQDRLRP